MQEVVDIARAVTGHKIPTRHTGRREGDPPELVADPAAAKRELGWVAEHQDMRGIIESAWRWHKAHPTWLSATKHFSEDFMLTRTRLSAMMFLEFFVWGAWYVSMTGFITEVGNERSRRARPTPSGRSRRSSRRSFSA